MTPTMRETEVSGSKLPSRLGIWGEVMMPAERVKPVNPEDRLVDQLSAKPSSHFVKQSQREQAPFPTLNFMNDWMAC